MARADHLRANPGFPFLSAADVGGVARFLDSRGWPPGGGRVASVGKAGEGNMNLTLRVGLVGGGRATVILKQARPWVEKYDFIDAPWERIVVEAGFYERVAAVPAVATMMPKLLASDAEARAALFEDLGRASDFTTVYVGEPILPEILAALARCARALHDATRLSAGESFDPLFENRDMRALNHQHIYVIPMDAANGIDLNGIEPGLADAAAELRGDAAYRARLTETGEHYLADVGEGSALLHGDFFPGSWLATADGPRVIDPEFCYYGDPAFDLAVAAAHLALAGRPFGEARAMLDAGGADLDESRLARYAAAEVMRRLIGVAQLPIPKGRLDRAALLRRSRLAMMNDSLETLWT